MRDNFYNKDYFRIITRIFCKTDFNELIIGITPSENAIVVESITDMFGKWSC